MSSSVGCAWASGRDCVESATVDFVCDAVTSHVQMFDAENGIDDARRIDFLVDWTIRAEWQPPIAGHYSKKDSDLKDLLNLQMRFVIVSISVMGEETIFKCQELTRPTLLYR